jgi:hypothetical protein
MGDGFSRTGAGNTRRGVSATGAGATGAGATGAATTCGVGGGAVTGFGASCFVATSCGLTATYTIPEAKTAPVANADTSFHCMFAPRPLRLQH